MTSSTFNLKVRKLTKKAKKDQGFSLLELVVATVLLGIVTSVAAPKFLAQRSRAYGVEAQQTASSLLNEGEMALVDGTSSAISGFDDEVARVNSISKYTTFNATTDLATGSVNVTAVGKGVAANKFDLKACSSIEGARDIQIAYNGSLAAAAVCTGGA